MDPNGVELIDLLKESGYPEKDIEFALKYSRYWYEEDEDETK